MTWDLVVVGAGPAGSAAALGALAADPSLRVLLLDREDFPRDKPCGDGVAPHVLDVLAAVGVHDLLGDLVPVPALTLSAGTVTAARPMARPALVVPRAVLDARLVALAQQRGAVLRRQRVRGIRARRDRVTVDGGPAAAVVIGADGAYSVVRRSVGVAGDGRTALALRGYAPTPPERAGQQVITLGEDRQPSYAWSFDRGDGLANVGYGELLRPRRQAPTRRLMLARLDELLPGAADGGTQWRAHHLPLSARRWTHPDGRVLLVGDAARLVNPLTGEGIYYAVATGVLAGRAAAAAVASGTAGHAAALYRSRVRALLSRHLRHTDAMARAARSPVLAAAGVRAAARDQRVFDDLVDLGLGQGTVRSRTLAAVVAAALRG